MPSQFPILEECTLHENGEFTHNVCGTKIMTVNVRHPVHDGPFPFSGGGGVDIELVPYCPACEERPSEQGTPVRQRQADVSETAILRNMREQR